MEMQDFLRAYVIERLDQMQEEKSKEPKEPNWVTSQELFAQIDKDVRGTLNELFKEKRIKVHKTIHASAQNFVQLIKQI